MQLDTEVRQQVTDIKQQETEVIRSGTSGLNLLGCEAKLPDVIQPKPGVKRRPNRYKERSDKGVQRGPRSEATAWRHREDGTYDNRPTSLTYYQEWYQNKPKLIVTCEFCNKVTGKEKLYRHHKSLGRMKFQTQACSPEGVVAAC